MGRSALGFRHLVLGVIAAIATSLMALGPAWAQTDPYPSPSPSPSPAPGDFEGDLTIDGNVVIGCGFVAGATVTILIDDVEHGTATADADGCVRVAFTAGAMSVGSCNIRRSSAARPSLRPGLNAAGLAQAGATTVEIPATGPGSHRVCLVGPRAGGGTLKLCGTVCVFAPGTTGGAAGGGILPFTGANLALWVFLAALLVLVGSLVVIASGRRRRVRA